jgi:hypothetical protein
MNQIEKILEVIGRPAPVIFLSCKIDLLIRGFFFFFFQFFDIKYWWVFFSKKNRKISQIDTKEKKNLSILFFPNIVTEKTTIFFENNKN